MKCEKKPPNASDMSILYRVFMGKLDLEDLGCRSVYVFQTRVSQDALCDFYLIAISFGSLS